MKKKRAAICFLVVLIAVSAYAKADSKIPADINEKNYDSTQQLGEALQTNIIWTNNVPPTPYNLTMYPMFTSLYLGKSVLLYRHKDNLYCLDKETGELLWEKEIPTLYSPYFAIYDDLIYYIYPGYVPDSQREKYPDRPKLKVMNALTTEEEDIKIDLPEGLLVSSFFGFKLNPLGKYMYSTYAYYDKSNTSIYSDRFAYKHLIIEISLGEKKVSRAVPTEETSSLVTNTFYTGRGRITPYLTKNGDIIFGNALFDGQSLKRKWACKKCPPTGSQSDTAPIWVASNKKIAVGILDSHLVRPYGHDISIIIVNLQNGRLIKRLPSPISTAIWADERFTFVEPRYVVLRDTQRLAVLDISRLKILWQRRIDLLNTDNHENLDSISRYNDPLAEYIATMFSDVVPRTGTNPIVSGFFEAQRKTFIPYNFTLVGPVLCDVGNKVRIFVNFMKPLHLELAEGVWKDIHGNELQFEERVYAISMDLQKSIPLEKHLVITNDIADKILYDPKTKSLFISTHSGRILRRKIDW